MSCVKRADCRFSGIGAKLFAWCVYLVAALATSMAVAQTTIDLEPPSIDHNVPAAVKAGKAVRVTAQVTDDGGVESVTLYYRTTRTGAYDTAVMENSAGAEYTAVVATSKNKEGLQYYIEAVDNGGNRVLEGGPGSPLTVETQKRSNSLLIAAGTILAIGLVAGLAGGDEDDDGSTNRDLVIQADVPSP